MNYPQIMYPLSPLPLKVGVMSPHLLWERRPWICAPFKKNNYPGRMFECNRQSGNSWTRHWVIGNVYSLESKQHVERTLLVCLRLDTRRASCGRRRGRSADSAFQTFAHSLLALLRIPAASDSAAIIILSAISCAVVTLYARSCHTLQLPGHLWNCDTWLI